MGDSSDNLHLDFHYNAVEGDFDWGVRRHFGNLQVNSKSPRAPHAAWVKVVNAAREGEAQLTAAMLELWNDWTSNHLIPRDLIKDLRTQVLMTQVPDSTRSPTVSPKLG